MEADRLLSILCERQWRIGEPDPLVSIFTTAGTWYWQKILNWLWLASRFYRRRQSEKSGDRTENFGITFQTDLI